MRVLHFRSLPMIGVMCLAGNSACLGSPVDDNEQRTGGLGLTFLLSRQFVQREIAGEEGNTLEWSNEKQTISYSRDWTQARPRHLPSGRNFCSWKTTRSDVEITFHPEASTIVLAIKPPEPWGGPDQIIIRDDSLPGVCALAEGILKSAKHSNVASRIRIDYISPDTEYFVMRNEVGQLRTARRGDTVTRNLGKVSEISENSVQIIEIAPDGKGDYFEVPIVIRKSSKAD